MQRKPGVKGRGLSIGLALAVSLWASAAQPAFAKLKVVTTFTVLADMARNVAGDAADVESITRPGAEIHGYQPTPRDLIRAQGAGLILWNGMNLELWFEQFLANMRGVPSAVLSEGVTPMPIREGHYEGKPNPHAWMSAENAMIYIDNIRDALSKQDPDNAAVYAANAEAYKAKVEAVMAPVKAELAAVPEDQRWLASCEGAFSYLARDLKLNEVYLWPINADQTGTPQQVRHMIDTVRKNKIPAVFCESTVNNDPAKQVARETGARFGGMLYVDSLSEAGGPVPTYLDLLKVTSGTIAKGLTDGSR
ncbi:metal ABC transporter substrate-binding protein [Roseibium litorale]|uniref:Metal ABC transporter substrate-binding protein n=1 Tax=Roseibium litorale TaxID=2803841 RepID=A0ABR9CSU2_9HYPH|nr:metal ABC transporter substrate-binding protein [Roseibium litorale]MBD8893917.1 metal ABC transporter substrate-binding protein [Roseibium litorale]